MKSAGKIGLLIIGLAALLSLAGCAGDDDDNDTQTGGNGGIGSLEIMGNYSGTITPDASLSMAVFPCPWQMPPDYVGTGTVDPTSGDVYGEIQEIETGTWCMMAYIDMDPDDGIQPVDGVDPVNATGEENENGALELTIVAGEPTVVTLTFAL